jgi:hypothetical protein
LFFYDLAWKDCELLLKDARGRKVAEQLIAIVFREKILSVMGNNSGVHWALVLTILTHHA